MSGRPARPDRAWPPGAALACRIGHTFSRDELLTAKERLVEDHLWAAVADYEEIAALLCDLIDAARRHGGVAPASFESRMQRALEQGARVRDLIRADTPVMLRGWEGMEGRDQCATANP